MPRAASIDPAKASKAKRKPAKSKPAKSKPARDREVKMHWCGDAGGKGSNGKPCGRKVPKAGARCTAHADKAAAMRQRDKSAVLAALEDGKHLLEAAREIKRDPATIWKWRQTDPEFDAAVREHCEENEEARVSAVEETLYRDIIEGKATSTDRIFYLTNRAKTRWKNKHSMEQLGADGQPIDHVPIGQIQGIVARVDNLVVNLTPQQAVELLGIPAPSIEGLASK